MGRGKSPSLTYRSSVGMLTRMIAHTSALPKWRSTRGGAGSTAWARDVVCMGHLPSRRGTWPGLGLEKSRARGYFHHRQQAGGGAQPRLPFPVARPASLAWRRVGLAVSLHFLRPTSFYLIQRL